jgi:DMSO reductase iron-sulfur subunit
MAQYGFFIDLSRCIGCNSCTVSCKQWHDIDPGPAKPMRVYQWETGNFPNIKLHMLPIMCFHCETPVCMDACPNNAIYKEEKYGAVLVDPDKCQGSRECWEACPYGVPQYHSDDPNTKMLKCDMCIDRLEEGLNPICVLSCSMRAMEFGPIDQLIRKYGNLNRLTAKPGYAPCRLACPAEVNAEGYIKLISEGKVKEALELFREATPFGGVLGRVCTHPCEADCLRGQVDQSVPIRSLKRYMADYELTKGRKKANPIQKTKVHKVAIIGSGPAGLSCANDLVRQGYPVTIFEAAAETGGMLRYGIPEYRLPNKVLDNEISYVEELGVGIERNKRIERLDHLFENGYKAIFLATGTWVSQDLGIDGEEASGVIYALDFLNGVNSGVKVELGDKVVVIGGGSAAIDAARAALRLDAKEIHLICLESKDLTCRDRMPAQDLEIEEAEEEGVIIHDCLGINRILSEKGTVVGLEMIACISVLDSEDRFAPRFSEGPAQVMETDTVIIAIGQKPDAYIFTEVERTPSGLVKADELTLETNIQGVFAGGDIVTGPADVISAIAAGKQAAVSIGRYLSGVDLRRERNLPHKRVVQRPWIKSPRPSVLPVENRPDFAEVVHGLDEKTALAQANRCLRCGSTMPCVIFNPVDRQIPVLVWNYTKALELWQKRQPADGEALPDIFTNITEVTEAPQTIVGRNELVLKAKNNEELLYYTTDNE